MGKKSKQIMNSVNGKGWRKRKRKASAESYGPCGVESCGRRGVGIYTCTTCERLGHGVPHSIVFCETHRDHAYDLMKVHAIKAHPLVNIPRAIIAGLKGEL